MSRRRLMGVALGSADPGMLVINARLVNVYSAEIISGVTVAVADGRIAWVGEGESAMPVPRPTSSMREGTSFPPHSWTCTAMPIFLASPWLLPRPCAAGHFGHAYGHSRRRGRSGASRLELMLEATASSPSTTT